MATGASRTSSVLTVIQSKLPVAEPTTMVPCYTLFKGNVSHSRVVHTSPDESLHALCAPSNKKARLLQQLSLSYNKHKLFTLEIKTESR